MIFIAKQAIQQTGIDILNWAIMLKCHYGRINVDLIWTTQKANPITHNQIIWYNYLFHVVRDMDIPVKLNNWATQIAHPYLSLHDPKLFDKDTIRNSGRT